MANNPDEGRGGQIASRESDCSIVLMIQGNACGGKGSSNIIVHAGETCTTRRGGDNMITKLAGIAETNEAKSKDPFTSLYHLINVELLGFSHWLLDAGCITVIGKYLLTLYP